MVDVLLARYTYTRDSTTTTQSANRHSVVLRQAWVDLPWRDIHLILYNRNIQIEETLLKVITNWLDGHDLGFDDVDSILFAAILYASLTAGKDTHKNPKHYKHEDKADRRPGSEYIHSRVTVIVAAWARGVDVIHSLHLRDTCEQENIDTNYRTLLRRYRFTITHSLLVGAKVSYL